MNSCLTKPIGKVYVLTLLCGSPLLANATIGGDKYPINQSVTDYSANSSADYVQQTIKITGTVVDNTGVPVIGANVVIKGTTNGTITDLDGKFSLDGPPNATLIISYVGFIDQEVTVKGNNPLSITLKEDAEALEEVVVVGFGTQKKVNLTGAVSSVTSEAFENRSVSNVSQALQGSMPGLNITQSHGYLNSEPDINIRGVGTSARLFVRSSFNIN